MVKAGSVNTTRFNRGAAAILVALMLLMLLGFAALAVDVGCMMVTKNELQNVADASALAAARKMGQIYAGLPLAEQDTHVFSRDTLVGVAQDIARKNLVEDIGLRGQAEDADLGILDGDVKIGRWNWGESRWGMDTLTHPDAISVTARRDESKNGPVPTLFARIWNIMNVSVSADATAALSSLGEIAPGKLDLPVGISSVWFDRGVYCGEEVTFYPTPSSCAGFTNFSETSSVNNDLKDTGSKDGILTGLREGTYETPEVFVPDTKFYFKGGTFADLFDELWALFDYKRTRDEDGNDDTWTTLVLVYDGEGDDGACENPNSLLSITGFATIILRAVGEPPDKNLEGTVICNKVVDGRGGGGNYGTVGTIPGLVE